MVKNLKISVKQIDNDKDLIIVTYDHRRSTYKLMIPPLMSPDNFAKSLTEQDLEAIKMAIPELKTYVNRSPLVKEIVNNFDNIVKIWTEWNKPKPSVTVNKSNSNESNTKTTVTKPVNTVVTINMSYEDANMLLQVIMLVKQIKSMFDNNKEFDSLDKLIDVIRKSLDNFETTDSTKVSKKNDKTVVKKSILDEIFDS